MQFLENAGKNTLTCALINTYNPPTKGKTTNPISAHSLGQWNRILIHRSR